MTCSVCNDGHTAATCTGATFRYDGGAGGVWTFCRFRMADAIAEHDDDPTLDRSWMQGLEVIA